MNYLEQNVETRSNSEILSDALVKAYRNGYNSFKNSLYLVKASNKNTQYFQIIFDHDFAKSIWGEGYIDHFTEERELGEKFGTHCHDCHAASLRWAYHLQQMAVAHNPLHYLAKFI